MAFIISRFDGDLTEARQHPGELQQGLRALHQREVGQPDLLDELELDKLRHAVGLAHPEHASDDVLRAVAKLECFVYIRLDTVVQHVLDQDRIGLVTNLNEVFKSKQDTFISRAYLKNIFGLDKTKSLECGLKVVKGLPHVPLGREHHVRELGVAEHPSFSQPRLR